MSRWDWFLGVVACLCFAGAFWCFAEGAMAAYPHGV